MRYAVLSRRRCIALVLGRSTRSRSFPEFLDDAPAQTVDLFARMWPIDWAYYPKAVHAALIETLHIADARHHAGAVIMAAPVALMVATQHHPLARSAPIRQVHPGRHRARSTRMVWALFFVAVFGPGALAGTLAIAVHSIGFIGKLLAGGDGGSAEGPGRSA